MLMDPMDYMDFMDQDGMEHLMAPILLIPLVARFRDLSSGCRLFRRGLCLRAGEGVLKATQAAIYLAFEFG
jgi:hypothetical protein